MTRGRLRRRDFVTGLASVLAVGCESDDSAPPRGGACADRVNLPCSDAELGDVVSRIQHTDRANIIQLAVKELRAGRSTDQLLYAAFSAGIRASSFRTHSNHTCKMVEASRQLSLATSGVEHFVPLMWSLDQVCPCPDGIQDPRDTGTPMGALSDVPLDEFLQRFLVDGAVLERGHEGNKRSFEHGSGSGFDGICQAARPYAHSPGSARARGSCACGWRRRAGVASGSEIPAIGRYGNVGLC